MAQEIEVKVKVVTGDAEKSFNSLTNSIKNLDKEATDLDATFEEIYGDLKPLTARMGEAEDRLYELAKAGKQNTKEYKDLLKAVGEYKRVQQQTDMVVDAAAQTMSSKLTGSLNAAAGGFSLAQGAMGLMGSESEELESAMLRVQSAMAISQGVESINEGRKSVTALATTVKSYAIVQRLITAGQWLWNAAMTANPIGLLVAGVAALIAGGVALTNYFKTTSLESKNNTKAIEENKRTLENQSKATDKASQSLNKNTEYQLEMAKASGASSKSIRQLELKLIDEKIAFANSSREIAKNTYHKNLNALASLKSSDADKEQIKTQEEITKKSLEEFGKQTKNLNDANAEKGNIIRRQNVEIQQAQTNHNKEISDKNITSANENAKKLKEDAKKKLEDAETERQEILTKQGEKARDEYEAAEKLIKDARKANEDSLKTENEIKVEKENADFETKKQDLINKGLSIEEIEAEHKRNLSNLDLEYYASESDKAIKSTADAKAQSEAKIKIAELEAKQKDDLLKSASDSMDAVAEIVGKNTVAGKSLAVASALINTYQGISAGVKLGYPQAIPAVLMASITGFKAVKSIMSVKVPAAGGGGGGGGSVPSSISLPSAMPVNPQVVGESGVNQLAKSLSAVPIKTYVVSTEMTNQQSMDRNISETATLG